MTGVDLAIIGIIIFSAVISLLRGFVREAVSLLSWVLAFWLGFTFASRLGAYVPKFISVPSLRLAIAFLVLFLVTLAIGASINFLIHKLVEKSGLSSTDRIVGVVFGAARGVVIVVVLVMLAGLTPMPRDQWWHRSSLLGSFQEMAIWVRGHLPPDIAGNFIY